MDGLKSVKNFESDPKITQPDKTTLCTLQLDVRDSLLDREAVEVLNEEAAEVSWLCSLSPLETASEALSPEELANCTLPAGRSFMHSEDRIGGGGEAGGAGGAIALAVVSATLFVAAVAVLAVLHRSGKLEQYL